MIANAGPEGAGRQTEPQPAKPQKPTVRHALAQGIRSLGGYVDRTFVHFDREVKPEDIAPQRVAQGVEEIVTHPSRLKGRPEDYTLTVTNVLDQLGYKGTHPNTAVVAAGNGLLTLTDMKILDMRFSQRSDGRGKTPEWRVNPGKISDLHDVVSGKTAIPTAPQR
jgi:hypothetical protein